MHKLLFAFLNVTKFFRKIRLSISGKTENDIYDERIVSGKSWDDYCDQLRKFNKIVPEKIARLA